MEPGSIEEYEAGIRARIAPAMTDAVAKVINAAAGTGSTYQEIADLIARDHLQGYWGLVETEAAGKALVGLAAGYSK